MARRPRSRNSKRKSSARSPSLHTLPWLPMYQKPAPRPEGKATVGGGPDIPCPPPLPPRTLCPRTSDLIGSIPEAQVEDIVGGAVGVQLVGSPAVANEAIQAAQHQDGAVDEFEDEQLVFA